MRALVAVAVCLAATTAHADIQKSGPEDFPGKHELDAHLDVVDWHAIDERFRELIAGERLPLAETAHPDA